jgi:hypothetical protein
MTNAPPEKAARAQERTNVILSKWLELQYNWEIERDKALFRSIEKVIKGKIAPDNKIGADELETELYKVTSSLVPTNLSLRYPKVARIRKAKEFLIKCTSTKLLALQCTAARNVE